MSFGRSRFDGSYYDGHNPNPQPDLHEACRAEVHRLKDQIRVLVEAMLNAEVDIPTGTYPINGPMRGVK